MEAAEKTVSQSEFAGIVKASRSAVCQAIQAGRFAPENVTPQGFLKYPAALQDWHENRDGRGGGKFHPAGEASRDLVSYETQQQKPAEANGAPAPREQAVSAADGGAAGLAPPAAAAPSGDPDYIQARPGTLAYERIELMRRKREKFEREEAVAAGRFVPIEDLAAGMQTLMREFREVIRQLPSEADTIVAEKGDVEKVRARLRLIATRTLGTLQERMTKLVETAATGGDPAEDADEEDDEDDQE